ncbi:MAG TPA: hypothetical protein VNW06_10325 [Cytophagaceae bacterium]|jgi:hypothetical protein|nr:hypothetical protein [Cytophagaceae bacterium]
MIEKNNFTKHSFEKLKKAILAVDDKVKDDVYALSFWFFTDNDDPRYPMIVFSYNTITNYKNSILSASDEEEAKWNFAFWLQDELEVIGGEKDKLLAEWFKTTPHYYSEEENEAAFDDDELFETTSEQGSMFCEEFIEEIIGITQQLFSEKIIETKFRKNIPILVHELEYYDEPVSWTVRSNPKGLVDEFVEWTKFE